MAESTLSITYAQIARAVAVFAGWDRDSTQWTADQTEDFGDILLSGLRNFYFPPTPESGEPRYEWSFLRKSATITVVASDGDYDLPDDFSGVILDDSVTFGAGAAQRRLVKVPEWHLRALRSNGETATGTPRYFAVRPKSHTDTVGLRYEILFYPIPSASATIYYRYVLAPDTISAAHPYFYGGAMHSETLLESVLAAAEYKLDDDPQGVHQQRFLQLLGASIRADREVKQRTKEPSDS
jgi:hypothetical protein